MWGARAGFLVAGGAALLAAALLVRIAYRVRDQPPAVNG